MEETTIAAISTAMSASGIGIVRISGPEAFEIASGVYRSKGGKKSLKNVPSHTIHYGYIYDDSTHDRCAEHGERRVSLLQEYNSL